MSDAQKTYDLESRINRLEVEQGKMIVVIGQLAIARALLERIRRHRWIFERLYADHREAIDEYLGTTDDCEAPND